MNEVTHTSWCADKNHGHLSPCRDPHARNEGNQHRAVVRLDYAAKVQNERTGRMATGLVSRLLCADCLAQLLTRKATGVLMVTAHPVAGTAGTCEGFED